MRNVETGLAVAMGGVGAAVAMGESPLAGVLIAECSVLYIPREVLATLRGMLYALRKVLHAQRVESLRVSGAGIHSSEGAKPGG